jgi:hypothetical protein
MGVEKENKSERYSEVKYEKAKPNEARKNGAKDLFRSSVSQCFYSNIKTGMMIPTEDFLNHKIYQKSQIQ